LHIIIGLSHFKRENPRKLSQFFIKIKATNEGSCKEKWENKATLCSSFSFREK